MRAQVHEDPGEWPEAEVTGSWTCAEHGALQKSIRRSYPLSLSLEPHP